MAKKSNDERLFPLYFYPTAFLFLLASAIIGSEVFFRFADPLDRFPAILEGDETLGYTLKNSTKGRFRSADEKFDLQMEINARGLRDREIVYPKPWNTTRILSLGGSPAFGWGLPVEETYSKVLEERLSELQVERYGYFEVLNGGVPGYTLSQSIKFYETELQKYKPDWVVLFLDADLSFDSINLHTLKKGTLKERPAPHYEVPFYCSMFQETVHIASSFCHNENRFFPAERSDDSSVNYTKRAEELETVLLSKLAEVCKEHGAKLLIVLPDNVRRSGEKIAEIAPTVSFPSLPIKKNYSQTGYLNKEETGYLSEKLFIFFNSLYSQKNPVVPTKSIPSVK